MIDNIYSSVPDEVLLNTNETQEYREPILSLLKSSEGLCITAKRIAEICGFPTRGTQVEVRKAITLLIEVDKEPIISLSQGFAYTTQSNQMTNYADRLEERNQGIQRRIKAVREIANRMRENGN